MNDPSELPALMPVAAIKVRLLQLFPESFANRGPLIGDMAARVVFVFLYGGFVEGSEHFLRPSFIYFFTQAQVRKTDESARRRWRDAAPRPGFRPNGTRWYADNSRESIRDDLIRNQLLELGIVARKAGVPTTSSKPIYQLASDFAALFSPDLRGPALDNACAVWRKHHLDPAVLTRMRLRGEKLGLMPPTCWSICRTARAKGSARGLRHRSSRESSNHLRHAI